jgi:hypothetical protein
MEANKSTEEQVRERADKDWHRVANELEAQDAEPGNELPQGLADELKPLTMPE